MTKDNLPPKFQQIHAGQRINIQGDYFLQGQVNAVKMKGGFLYILLISFFISCFCDGVYGQKTIAATRDSVNLCEVIDSDTITTNKLNCNLINMSRVQVTMLQCDSNNGMIDHSEREVTVDKRNYTIRSKTFRYDSVPLITLVNYETQYWRYPHEHTEFKPGNMRDYIKIGDKKYVFDEMLYGKRPHREDEPTNADIRRIYMLVANHKTYLVFFIDQLYTYSTSFIQQLVCAFDITDTAEIIPYCLGFTRCTTIKSFGNYQGKNLNYLKLPKIASEHSGYDTLYCEELVNGKEVRIKDKYIVMQDVWDHDIYKIICDKSRWFDMREYKNR